MDTRTRARRGLRAGVVVALVALLCVPAGFIGVAAADVDGSPQLEVYGTDTRVSPGEVTRVGVSVVNTGEIGTGSQTNPSLNSEVTTAKGTVLTLRSGSAPITVREGTAAVGSVPSGAAVPTTFEIEVDEGAAPGTYRVPVDIEYEFTNRITDGGFYDEDNRDRTKFVTITVAENARFELVDADTDAAIGGSGQVEVTLRNTGSATADDATVSLRSGSGDLQFGAAGVAETFVGDLDAGEETTVTVGADVARDATLRALPLSATVSWTDGGTPAEERLATGVIPATETRLDVGSATTTAGPGESGEVTLSVTNTGDRDLSAATLRLASENAGFTFGESPSTATFVGDWAAGETKEVTVEAAFARGVEQRAYPLEATVAYTSEAGRDASTAPVTVGVTPADEQAFDVTDAGSDLRVGADGTVSGTLVNDGPSDVENAVLVLQPTGSTLDAVETEFALGDLAAGDSTDFSFDIAVSSSAKDGPRQLTYRVEYETSDGTTTQSDPIFVRAPVDPSRDVFDVTVGSGGFEAGSSGAFVLEVTNAGDETVTDVSAQLFADAPVSANDDEAFIDELGPGETATLRFGIGVAGSATADKTYPVSVDFQYTEPDGDTKLSDSYRLPVTVEASSGGGLLAVGSGAGVGVGVLALALVAIGGVVRFRS
jgi:hypothetical protein